MNYHECNETSRRKTRGEIADLTESFGEKQAYTLRGNRWISMRNLRRSKSDKNHDVIIFIKENIRPKQFNRLQLVLNIWPKHSSSLPVGFGYQNYTKVLLWFYASDIFLLAIWSFFDLQSKPSASY